MNDEVLFQWSDDYKIGNAIIDREHIYIFDLLRRLHEVVENEEGDRSTVVTVLSELLDYTQTHFRKEEELMRRNDYAEYEEHLFAHDGLINKVEDLIEEYQDGEPVLTYEVMLFLKDWLLVHILQMDINLAMLSD